MSHFLYISFLKAICRHVLPIYRQETGLPFHKATKKYGCTILSVIYSIEPLNNVFTKEGTKVCAAYLQEQVSYSDRYSVLFMSCISYVLYSRFFFLPRDSLAKNEILHSEYTTVVACSTQPRIYIEVLADNRASNPAREKCTPPTSGDSFGKILNMNRLKFNVIYTLCTDSAHEPSNGLYKMNHNCKLSTEQRRRNFVTARNGVPEGNVFNRVCLSTGGRWPCLRWHW